MNVDPIWSAIDSAAGGRGPSSGPKLAVTSSPKVELMLVAAMLDEPEFWICFLSR